MRIKKLTTEFIGTAVLLISVVGSSYMAEKLTSDKALSLLIVGAVTAAALAIIIKSGADISGSHYNPVVTGALALQEKI
jgi:glycerol uptake facilitator-like aquaporin